MFLSNNEGSHNDQARNIINQSIDSIISNYGKQIAELKVRADDSIPIIKDDIEQCSKITGDLYCDISSYEDRGYGFIVESDEDGLIAADIQNCINNWDGDGRTFRDTKYNYDYCFSLVKDEQLYKDYQLVKSWTDK